MSFTSVKHRYKLQVTAKTSNLLIDTMTEGLLCRLFSPKQLELFEKNPAFKEAVVKTIKRALQTKYYPLLAKFCVQLKQAELKVIQQAINDYIAAYPKGAPAAVDLVHSFETSVRPEDLIAQVVFTLHEKQHCGSGAKTITTAPLYTDMWDGYNKFVKFPDKYEGFLKKRTKALRKKLVQLLRLIVNNIAKYIAKVLKHAKEQKQQQRR